MTQDSAPQPGTTRRAAIAGAGLAGLAGPAPSPLPEKSTAIPKLINETLRAQSAHIDAVSGASYTSQGYLQSLQSTLDKARG